MTKPITVLISGHTCCGKEQLLSTIQKKYGEDKVAVLADIFCYKIGQEGTVEARNRRDRTKEMDKEIFFSWIKDLQYGKKSWYNYTQTYYDKLIPVEKTNYDLWVRNCEHAANGFVFGINLSSQVDEFKGGSRSFNLKDEIAESSNKWNKLTSSDVSGLRYQMHAYIRQADQFHQVERPKFSERINFSPKRKIQ